MAVFLFDEKRWYEENPSAYADFLHGAVSDLIVIVYGTRQGGVVGWKSRYIGSMAGVSKTKLTDVITAMHARGIRVHAAFNACRVNRMSIFESHKKGSKFVDVHDTKFQSYISDLMAECAALPVDGICIDYCRTDDYTNPLKNDASIGAIVKMTYEKVKRIKPDCVVSCTTTPYLDISHPQLKRTGRKAIRWANNGYQDILFDMKYGNYKGKYGDPPDMEVVYKARKLTSIPVVVMVSSYKKDSKGSPVPTDAVQFSQVLDAVFYEQDIAIYTGWLFTKEHAVLIRQTHGEF